MCTRSTLLATRSIGYDSLKSRRVQWDTWKPWPPNLGGTLYRLWDDRKKPLLSNWERSKLRFSVVSLICKRLRGHSKRACGGCQVWRKNTAAGLLLLLGAARVLGRVETSLNTKEELRCQGEEVTIVEGYIFNRHVNQTFKRMLGTCILARIISWHLPNITLIKLRRNKYFQ